ncbi:MAG: lytic transglycosylase domain-containing protein [Deltaproteobacteria bacterium]|nr:MAG: lytic transglycosylase domain-containing protein [Deltaproteobacteria bacterium]
MRTVLVVAALALAPRAGAAAVSSPCAANSGPQGPDDPRLREWLRHVLEALGMTETALQPALGRACEVGPFQVMPWWAGVFSLDSPQLLWDPRINAIAAARIYKAAWRRWDARFARAGANRVLRAAGWRGPLDRETFAALAYNWGKAPQAFAQAADLRTVPIPASTASYALRFSQALREARQRARADNGIPRARPL